MEPNGDMTVVGLVNERHLIEDIGIAVPKGTAVTIPGHLTIRSKDLYRGLSSRALMQLHRAPAPAAAQPGGISKAEEARLRGEIEHHKAQAAAHEARADTLEQQVQELQDALARKTAESAKLDDILQMLKDRPATTVVNEVHHHTTNGVVAPASRPPEEVVDGEAPHFIPSQIRGETSEERVSDEETTSESSGVAAAASKLGALRKKKQ